MKLTYSDSTLWETAKRLIEKTVCQTMPTTAIASGLVSGVNPDVWVKAMGERFPYDARPADLGMPGLTAWLKEHGIEAGASYTKALRHAWLMDRFRTESRGMTSR